MRIVLCFTILLGGFNLYSQDYYSDRLFIKVKEEYKNSYSLEKDVRFLKIIRKVDMTSIQPVSKHPLLNHTYEVVLRNKQSLDAILLPLNQLEQIDFAEKVPIYQLFFTPNDPLYSTQWNLAKIQADQAWNLSQGCASIKIAVTDDGFLMNHEDLVNQWHINSGEINGNGIDDDGNGYIDDWRGWDAANNDNDPSATAPTNSFFTHGTHVAGIIAGQTHNSKGIAAIGYNCKMIPVKIGLSPNSSLTGAFQGLDYAINASGCDVINMSWGGGGKSATYQTLFNIAKTKGIICVAAAGNSNSSNDMYPASYNHVISVAASANTDVRASFSNYGSTIDVTAPGVGIPSCLAGATNSYGNMSGTSMASPLVAGLCGLMKCYNPLPADSIEACLKRTCDNIAAQNPILKDSLGAGRINAFQALQCLTKKPKSDFIALDTIQCIGKSVRYIAKSFGIPTLTYNWSFPGGSPSTSTIANPVVTYGANGLKSATLITCNSLGCDTITKTNYVSIDTPRAWLTNRKYTSYNSNPVIVTLHFKGNTPFNVTLTDGTNNFTQTNIRSNPYFFSIVPKKDTNLISISAFSDSLCVGNRYGVDTIHRTNLGKDTTICVVLKTSNPGALDLAINYNTNSPSTYVWSDVTGEFTTERWTSSGTPTSTDGVLKFNLTSIPSNAIINSATISLYSNNSVANWAGQPTAGTNNAAKLSRITSNWSSPAFPNTFPSFSSTNQISLAQTPTTSSNHINIDAKNLLQDIISNGNNGILFHLNTTSFHNSLQMHSWQSSDTSKHPKLVVCYTIPGGGSQYCESSFKFNGTNNNVVKITPQNGAAFKDLYSTNGFTWECWFNLGNRNGASVTGVESLVGATDAQLCEDIGFHFNWPWSGSGKFNWVVSGQTNCSVPRGVVGTNMTFNANTWYHAAGVMNYNTNTMQLYINGNLMNSGTLTIPMSQRMQNSVAVTIGNQDVNYNPYHTLTPFNGKIDEVRFWNSVRTASEIQSSYKSCLPASTSNLVAYFKADEGTGTNTVSLVNGNFVGTLQNAASWDSQVDSVKNCTLCSTSLCRDSTEINSGQTGWQALQTNGTWGTLVSSSYCAGTFTANSSLFPGVSAANCLWGPTVNTGTRTAYNSSSHTTTSTFSGSFPYLKKQFTLPSGSVIDSVRLWMISDDYIDSVWVNNKVVYKATNPIHYGQIVMTGAETNLGNSISPLNEVIVKPGDFGGCYGTYFRMKVYYSKVCGNSTSDCDTTNLNTGKVLHLDFNGNTQDNSGNGNHATNFGATPAAGKDGIANTAYKFNGSSNYMKVLNSSTLGLNSAFSVTCKIKIDGFNSDLCRGNMMFFKGHSVNVTGNQHFDWFYAPNAYTGSCSAPLDTLHQNLFSGTLTMPSPVAYSPYLQRFKWYCFVAVQKNDTIYNYIDGIMVYKASNTGTSSNPYDIFIGKSDYASYPYWLNATIDDIRVYNRSLAPNEIKGYCGTCNVTPPQDCDTTNLNAGKVLHLDFNGNTQDKSGNSNHATNFGATPVAGKAGVANTAYRFDGVNDYMQVSHATSLSPSSVTMTAIIKPRSFNADPCMGNEILTKGYDLPGGSGRYCMRYSPLVGNCTAFGDTILNNFYPVFKGFSGCATSIINDTPKVKTNRWYCLVMSYGNDTIKTYIDGILRHSCYFAGPLGSNTFDLFIGKHNHPAGTFPYWLSADIDEIRIYNRVLVPSEVKGYCGTCNVTPPSDCDTSNLNTGKVLHLDFNGNTQDKSGNSNHATNFGATPVAGKAGVANTAYKFNGSSNYMEIPHSSSLNPNSAITMTAIVKVDGYSPLSYNASSIMSKALDGSSGFYTLRLTDDIDISVVDTNTSVFYGQFVNDNFAPIFSSVIDQPAYIQKNNWYCVVFTFDGDSCRMYINGNRKYAYKSGINQLISTSGSLRIGSGLNANPFQYFLNGVLDDIRIYNRALAHTEVKGYCGLCSSVQPPPCDTSRRYTYNQCLNDSIQVLASAGSKYQWSPVSGLSNDTIRNPKVFVSNNQRYLVSYTSLKNCQLIDTIDVEVKAAAIYPKLEDQLICIGDSVQMTIPINATNIVWSPNASISSTSSKNPYFFPTSPTTYYLEFRDTFGCLHRDTFVVNTKVCCPARARFTIPKDLLCFGETLPITNTSKGPITSYSWNFGSAIPNTFAGANPPILTFPSGGSYTLRLIVTNGVCFDTMIKTVSVIQINPNAGKDTNNCLAAFTTQLGESPISDWTYKWTPTQYLNDATIADPICSIVNDSINYILEIMDRNSGCKAYDTVVVYTNRTIDSTAQNLRICFGDSVLFNGIYRKTTNNYFYTIKKADGICDSFINLLRLNVLVKQDIPLVPKVRCKFYIDNKGKRYTSSFIERDTIRSKSILNCDSIIYITPIQIFQTDTSSRNVNGCSPFRYNGKTYLTSKLKADSFIIRGAYSGCDSIIEYIHVTVHPKPKAVITPSIPNPVLYKQTVTLSASGGQTYFWLQTGSNVPDIYYKINDISPKLFTVRVTDENDCWDTVSYLVQGKLPEKCYYGFPNVFSPNEDNLNDEYLPNMDECTEVIIFAIYDRWGEKVFETNQLKGWNGYFKGRPAPMGVYVYFAKLKTPWGIKEHQGSFTLMR